MLIQQIKSNYPIMLEKIFILCILISTTHTFKIIESQHESLMPKDEMKKVYERKELNETLSCNTLSIRTQNLQLYGYYASWWRVPDDDQCEKMCYEYRYGKPLFAWTFDKSAEKCYCMISLYSSSPAAYSNTNYDSGFFPNYPSLSESPACQHFKMDDYLIYPIPAPVYQGWGIWEDNCAQYICGNEFWIWKNPQYAYFEECYCFPNTNNYQHVAISYSKGDSFGLNGN